jgi:rare lipoprotein A
MAHVVSWRYFCFIAGCIFAVCVCVPCAHGRDISARLKTHKRIVRASWYGCSFQGKPTADGGTFNPRSFTAAHRTIELGSKVKVTELRSGRSVVVEITDRGPYLPGRDIDLSYAAAHALGIVRSGIARVRVELLNNEEPVSAAPMVTALSWPAAPWLPLAVVE